eukprot:CAMPEP_0117081308 /NCGR_PEP_ID=MMETSP0472-20121206/57316_1 /TAXON_ID=693140 ORGANISM="Tiarina fusus, Strain LIS" /NCGR_SAMPLE_ID=MMETSP0472 /ASSEMBLY_ACC=CAM_ASM_000603 /LENGTH=203 /DNA_ID=CAMNT_0004809203 /DNA_START=68 /DNA_END=676 /DNA_ORIENTATION=+
MAARTVNDYSDPRSLRRALESVDEDKPLSDSSNHDLDDAIIVDVDTGQPQQQDDVVIDESWDWVLTNYDAGTTNPQSITQELHRLQVLKSYGVLDADRQEAFDRLTNMACRVFGVPIALVSLVDLGRQWFLSKQGLGAQKNDVFMVNNALEDSRFCDSPLVQGPPDIRFYAGAPLLSPEGYKLGTFCIIDSKPRQPGEFSADD